MNLTVSKSQFKPKALEYLRMVEKEKKILTVTNWGEPVVDIVPHKKANKNDDPLLAFKGKLIKYDNPFEPVGMDDWEALK